MARRQRGFYDKPVHVRLGQRIVEGLISAGAVYLLSPMLIKTLAPVQAKINADAVNNGQPVSNVGTNVPSNALLQLIGS